MAAKLPKVELTSGFEVRCDHPTCGRIGFEHKRAKAEQLKNKHEDIHIEHELKIKKLLANQAKSVADEDMPDFVLPELRCPTCLAGIGFSHLATCDVARCLPTGAQRLFREHIPTGPEGENHNCGMDIWTGYYPGEKEATEYGVPMDTLKREGHWDAEKVRWILPDDWAEKLQARVEAEQAAKVAAQEE